MYSSVEKADNSCLEHARSCPYMNEIKLPQFPPPVSSDYKMDHIDLMEQLLLATRPSDRKSIRKPPQPPTQSLPLQLDSLRTARSEVLFRMDTRHFLPAEVDVEVVEDKIVIHGKHPDYMDEHGLVAREFTRRAKIPEDVDKETVVATYDGKGILSILANKIVDPKKQGKRVPLKLVRSALDNY